MFTKKKRATSEGRTFTTLARSSMKEDPRIKRNAKLYALTSTKPLQLLQQNQHFTMGYHGMKTKEECQCTFVFKKPTFIL